MRKGFVLLRAMSLSALAGCMILPASTGVLAQRKPKVVTPTDADAAAGRDADVVFMKAWSGARPKDVAQSKLMFRGSSQRLATAASKEGDGGAGGGDDFSRIPGTLSFLGGQVVKTAESHNIYLLPAGTTVAQNWGDPETFLTDLGKSEFIHVTDQYVGDSGNNRYTLGVSATVPNFVVTATPLTDGDVRGFVHALAAATGETGYGHIYHVFIPPGQDECMRPGVCASNVFCAYHGSATFADIGHVLYSVEPFTDVLGCQVRPGTPNGQLVDSTNDVLSHELIETITDPDGRSWLDVTSGGMLGEEIGDECVFVTSLGLDPFTNPLFGDPVTIDVNGRKYAIQPEWDNRAKACTAER